MQTSAVRVHRNPGDSKLHKQEFEDWKTDGGNKEGNWEVDGGSRATKKKNYNS